VCAAVPAGRNPDPERPGCPLPDADRDGVADTQDRCADTAQGLIPDDARPGCPAADRDQDSVADPVDACPDEPGAPHPDPRRNGCPSLVSIEHGQIRILEPVFFATNRETILARSMPVLRAVANALLATPQIRRVSIEGHTDDIAGDDFNLDLSTDRAANVLEWLVTEGGIERARLEAHGYGETRPLEPGATERARAANRRVEFHIIDPPQAGDP
jgi:OOP family OmpA-OmpF porin